MSFAVSFDLKLVKTIWNVTSYNEIACFNYYTWKQEK